MNLPFTRAEFLDLFVSFNRATWPLVVLLWCVSCWAAIGVARARVKARLVLMLLAVQWLWSGIGYHAWFFTRINPAAHAFAAVFIAQGLAFAWAAARNRVDFSWEASLRQVTGLALLAASLAYPLLVLADGHRFPAAPGFGLPCPTTLFTAGVLLSATSAVPRGLLLGPIAWSLVGGSAALLLGMTPDLLLFAAAIAMSLLLLPDTAQRRLSNWFTSDRDVAAPMSGDWLAPTPTYAMTLSRVVSARPEHVWPWLAQLGYHRGGLYSYDWLDRLFGYLDVPSATEVLPQFQDLHPGDEIPVGRGTGFPVVAAEPNRLLVLGGQQHDTRWSWEIDLERVDAEHTRIVSRSRGMVPRTLGARVFVALLGPAAFLMTRRMLIGLAARAERLAASRVPKRTSAVA